MSDGTGRQQQPGDSYHHSLALVLNDVTRTANLVATTKAEELQLISWIDGLFGFGNRHRGGLPLGGHGAERDRVATERHRSRKTVNG